MNILFHDDWEINGDGTGDPRKLMFEPLRKMLGICDRYGVRYTIFAEVMQQFAMLESAWPIHRKWAQEWEEVLRDAVSRGHDVQLHIHPQWKGAYLEADRFALDYSQWNLARLEESEIYDLVSRGKEYLETLLRPEDPDYRVVAFRSGGWMAQPSGPLVRALQRAGINADCSVVPGKKLHYPEFGGIDYTDVPDSLLPWCADSEDVSRFADGPSGFVELPTYAETFRVPLPVRLVCGNLLGIPHYCRVYARKREKDSQVDYAPKCDRPVGRSNWKERLFATRTTYGSFGYLHHRALMRMCQNAFEAARAKNVPDAPLVLLTHSKSLFAFSNFEKFVRRLSKRSEFRFSTTRHYVERLMNGEVDGLPLVGDGELISSQNSKGIYIS